MSITDNLPSNVDSEIIDESTNSPENIDSETIGEPSISSSRAGNVATGSERQGLRSHMLLAACSHSESARECYISCEGKTRGQFTVALLALFRREGVDKLAYKDILSRLNPMTE